jgi:hypothetical protein
LRNQSGKRSEYAKLCWNFSRKLFTSITRLFATKLLDSLLYANTAMQIQPSASCWRNAIRSSRHFDRVLTCKKPVAQGMQFPYLAKSRSNLAQSVRPKGQQTRSSAGFFPQTIHFYHAAFCNQTIEKRPLCQRMLATITIGKLVAQCPSIIKALRPRTTRAKTLLRPVCMQFSVIRKVTLKPCAINEAKRSG